MFIVIIIAIATAEMVPKERIFSRDLYKRNVSEKKS